MTMYANAAERQRAYRERYRQRIEQRIETHEKRLERLQEAIDELQRLLRQVGMGDVCAQTDREAA
jgi:chaperonin cofactor prefoldin